MGLLLPVKCSSRPRSGDGSMALSQCQVHTAPWLNIWLVLHHTFPQASTRQQCIQCMGPGTHPTQRETSLHETSRWSVSRPKCHYPIWVRFVCGREINPHPLDRSEGLLLPIHHPQTATVHRCTATYVGQTGRCLGNLMKEHQWAVESGECKLATGWACMEPSPPHGLGKHLYVGAAILSPPWAYFRTHSC